ncbi:MAG: CcmD family protein [Thermoleophilia bacterium]|nr:CcmD family protein [Thermoleophilia bacterium]
MQYVVSAYAVIWVLLVLYVVALGMRSARLGREAELLARMAEAEDADRA